MHQDHIKKRFFAVATSVDKIKSYPDLINLNWIPLQAKSVTWTNCKQLHFELKEKAQEFYDLLKSRDIITFKNW